jgi:hypothetical protein
VIIQLSDEPATQVAFSGHDQKLGLCGALLGSVVAKAFTEGVYRRAYRSAGFLLRYNGPVSYSGCYREDGVIISRLSGLHSADAQRLRNLSV